MTGSNISLEVKNLSCIRDDRVLFDALSFTLLPGQVLLLEGQNGSGKSSLLRILCGFREPEAGAVFWCGRQLPDPFFLQQMAYVGHLDGIKKELTVMENLKLALALNRSRRDTVQDVLSKVHLAGYDDVMVGSLSAGQKRRLSLARLLITESQLWILDEPFTSLDKEGIAVIEVLISEFIADNGLVILTSHHELNLPEIRLKRIRLSQ